MKLPFNEHFLQFVWQYQYFDHQNLITNRNETIEIVHPGHKNADGGPDFLNAKVKIGDLLWVGSIEIHLNTSGWNEHKHHTNAAYDTVILHVVYENHQAVETLRKDHSSIPLLVLKEHIAHDLIQKGNELFENIAPIPCEPYLEAIDSITRMATLDRSLFQRLERKAHLVLEMLNKNQNDWEETTYQLITQHFGMKVNNDPFLRLAQVAPLKLILKSADQIFSVEALLFGQAGFLEYEIQDDYHQKLRKEYQYLKHKFGLANAMRVEEWKHLRLRPHNFPEIRIAELAALLSKTGKLHSELIAVQDTLTIRKLFKTDISQYWQNHYGFGKPSKMHLKGLGELALDNLLINVVAILLVAYSIYKSDEQYIERASQILESLPAENNKIVREWNSLTIKPANAFESQALIELFNSSCSNKACLNCQIGVKILGR